MSVGFTTSLYEFILGKELKYRLQGLVTLCDITIDCLHKSWRYYSYMAMVKFGDDPIGSLDFKFIGGIPLSKDIIFAPYIKRL